MKEGGSVLMAHMRDIQESAGSRQLDRLRSMRLSVPYFLNFGYECPKLNLVFIALLTGICATQNFKNKQL